MFEAAARHESFARAARELSVTPGAVSRVVKELEGYIGVQLFIRGRRGVRLTAAAREYAGDVAPALRQIALACTRVRMSGSCQSLKELAVTD
jgi:DNA-binding transcriptional LysR family regulator